MSILDPKPLLPATLEEHLPERLSEPSLSATYGPTAPAMQAAFTLKGESTEVFNATQSSLRQAPGHRLTSRSITT